MSLSLLLCLINLGLVLAIAARLKIHKTGIFTIGFFGIGTSIFPYYVYTPLYSVLAGSNSASRACFDDALLVVMTMLAGLLVGMWSTREKTAPLYSRIPELDISLRVHFILLGIGITSVLAVFFFLANTVNPFEIIPRARSLEFRVKYEEFDLGYPLLMSLGTALFFHGWLIVKLFATSRSFRSLLLSVVATGITMFATACYGSRAALFSPLVILLFVSHHLYRPIPMTFVAVLFVISIPVFVFSRLVASGFDLNNIPRGMGLSFVFDEFISRLQLFDGFLDFMDWFKTKPFAYGETLLDVFVRPIPRQFLPNKPQSFDVFLSHQIYGRAYYGGGIQIFGGIAEMFYNFGYAGVFVWFILLGKLTYRLHFGLAYLVNDRRTLAIAMIITNYGLLRGVTNFGVNTIASQQILVALGSQALFCGIVYAALRTRDVILGRRRKVPSDLPLRSG
jgi:oligosaccharide repeat unit polymerase